jgi:hypothetical protein
MVQEKTAAAKDKAADDTETKQVGCMSLTALAAEPGTSRSEICKNAEHTVHDSRNTIIISSSRASS